MKGCEKMVLPDSFCSYCLFTLIVLIKAVFLSVQKTFLREALATFSVEKTVNKKNLFWLENVQQFFS